MQSIRLNASLRDKIINNALVKSGVLDEVNQHELAMRDFAKRVRVAAFGGEEKAKLVDEKAAQIQRIEDELSEAGCANVYVNFNRGSDINAAFNGLRICLPYGKGEDNRYTFLLTPKYDKCLFSATDPLSIEFTELEAKGESINKKKDDLKTTVTSILNSVSTTKRLIEVWPEAKELLPDSVEREITGLPALHIADVNKLIGLPTA